MRKIRFAPDTNTLATIFLNDDGDAILGLVVNESYTGFSAVICTTKELEANEVYKVKVGELKMMPAKLKWIKKLDAEVLRLGFEYQE